MPSLLPDDIDDPIAEQYRSQLESFGQDLRFVSNRDIVKRLGDNLINSGRTNDDIASTYGEGFLSKYLDEKNKPVDGQGVFGDAMASLRRQAIGLGEIAMGGLGLAADAAPGELLDPVRDAAMRKAAELSRSAAEGPQPTIDSYADVRMDRPMEVLRYGANLMGGALPSVAQAALTGGAGGLVGLTGQNLLKKKLRQVLGDATEDQIASIARKKAFKTGAGLGLASSSGVMGTGEVYSQLYPFTQLSSDHEDYIDPDTARNVSFAGGALVAGLDFASAGKMLNKLLRIGDKESEQYLMRLVKNLPEGVFLEGSTEAAQEFIIMASEKYARQEDMYALTGQEVESLINAGIMGAAGGSQFSMLSAIPGPKSEPREIDDSDKPRLDISRKPDVSALMDEAPGETYGFEVGQEVSEPYGISGKIEKIDKGIATVRSTTTGADGVEVTKIKQVPTSHLAPVFEKPEVKDVVDKSIKEARGGMDPEAAPDTAVSNQKFSPPEDSYTNETETEPVETSAIANENAKKVYNVLSELASNRESGVKRGHISNFKQLLRDGKIDQDTYDRATENKREALNILRDSGILGEGFEWKKDTAFDQKLEEDKVFAREKKYADTRKRRIESQGIKVDEESPQVIKARGNQGFYQVKDIIVDEENPQEDGFVVVDQFDTFDKSTGELKDGVATDLRIDPRVLNSPMNIKLGLSEDRDAPTPYQQTEVLHKLPEFDPKKGIKFRLFTAKGRESKGSVLITGDTVEDLIKNIKQSKEIRKFSDINRPAIASLFTTDNQEVNVFLDRDVTDGNIVGLTIGDEHIDFISQDPNEKWNPEEISETLKGIYDKNDIVVGMNEIPKEIKIKTLRFDTDLKGEVESGTVSEVEFGAKGGGRAYAVFENIAGGQYPQGSIRVVSTTNNNDIRSYDLLKRSMAPTDNWSDGYKLVGFITASEYYKKKVDIYYDSAVSLRNDLLRGSYVQEQLSEEGLPKENLIAETDSRDQSIRGIQIKLRIRERELLLENPDYKIISNNYKIQVNKDGKVEVGDLVEGEDEIHKNLTVELMKKSLSTTSTRQRIKIGGEFKKTSLEKANASDVYSILNRKKEVKITQLMDAVEAWANRNDVDNLTANQKKMVAGFKGSYLEFLNKQYFEKYGIADISKALIPMLHTNSVVDIPKFAKKLYDETGNRETIYDAYLALKRGFEHNPEFIDKAREDSVAFQQLLQYYIAETGAFSAEEAQRIITDVRQAKSVSRSRAEQLRSKGNDAKDKELYDVSPRDLLIAAAVNKKIVPYKGIENEISRKPRIEAIDKALQSLEEDGIHEEIVAKHFNEMLTGEDTFASADDIMGDFGNEMSFDDQMSIMQIEDDTLNFQASMPNRIDLVTGAREPVAKLPITPEDIDADEELSKKSSTAIIAPKDNPLETRGYPELVKLAQSAIERFTEGGDLSGSFSGKLALKRIIDNINPSYTNGNSLTFWSSMLRGSSSLENIRIKFMPWSDFRKYARVTEHGITTGVYRPGANEIVITDTFYNDPDQKITADEALANLLVHEIAHVPVRLGMEVGRAQSLGDRDALNELSGLGLGIDNEGLGKIYDNVKNVVIPYLQNVNKEFGVNPREYALTSVEEFFAELASNYELRHILKKARMTPELSRKLGMSSKNPFKTLWQWIRRLVTRIAGVEPNLLDTADNYLKSIIKKAQPMGKYMGQLPFDDKRRAQQILFDFDPKVEEAPSDLPTFWGLYKIDKNGPKVYQQVADVIVSPGNEYLDGDIAYQYAEKLGLNRKKLYSEIQRAHRRHWAKTSRKGYRYSQAKMPNWRSEFRFSPTNSEVSLDIIQAHRGRIFNDYLEAFEEDSDAEDVSNVINDEPKNRMERESVEILDPALKGLLRALEKEDWLGFDYPSGSIMALFEEDFFDQWEVSPNTKAAITRYVNKVGSEDYRYSQKEMPKTKFPNKEPDAGAIIYHEANAAANNEVVRELTKVYSSLGESLPDEFKGKDGLKKFIDKFGNKIDKRMKGYAEKLGIERDQVDKLSIGDQGLNRRARDRAMINAVKYLSKIREDARKKKAKSGESLDNAKETIAAFERLHEKMLSGNIVPPSELAESLASKILNQLHVPEMESLLKQMKDGTEVSVEDLNKFRSMVGLNSRVADAMEAIIEMPDSVETLKLQDIVDRIQKSMDPRLEFLRENKFGLYAFAKKTKISSDLYILLRIAKDADRDRKRQMMEAVGRISAATNPSQIQEAINDAHRGLRKELQKFGDLKKEALKVQESYGKDLADQKVYEALDGQILARETSIRTALGELEPIDIRHGITMKVMRRKRDSDGNIITSGQPRDQWEIDDYKIRYKGGKLDDRDGFVKANTETLQFLRDDKAREAFSHEPWYDIMREQANRAMNEPVGDQYFTIRKQAWMAGIESLNARLNRLGYEGKKLGGMLSQTSALFRDLNSDVQYYAKRWNVSYLNLMDKLGMDGKTMFTSFYQDLWYWMDNHPEFDGNEEGAVNAVWEHLKEYGNISDKSKLNSEAKKAMVTLMRRTLEARDFEADYNFSRLGNRIKDDFKVESLINGEMVDFYRRPVELGYATIPRVLNEGAIFKAMSILKKETKEGQGMFSGQWSPSKSSEDSVYKRLVEANNQKSLDMESLRKEMSKLFTDDVVNDWVGNYLSNDARKSQFFGPDDSEVGNSFINAMWAEAKREASGTDSFFIFLDKVYDHYRNNGYITEKRYDNLEKGYVDVETTTREQWYFSMTKQFQSNFDHLHRAYKEIMKQNDGHKTQNMLMNSPRSLDSRQLAAKLPREYFYYDSYDEVTSAVRLQMMIATSVFGRGGEKANALRGKADERYAHDHKEFLGLLTEATGADHKGLQSDYNKQTRRKVYDILRMRPRLLKGRSPEQAFEDLFANAAAHGEMEVIFDHLNKYYGSGNVAGPFRDANVPLELLGLQSISVLNNPKSAFWQGLSLTEFPMAFHGMNGMALKATGKGFMTFIDQTFGGILEALGLNVGRAHRYADYLANTHFRNSEADLTYKEYTSQVGSGAELSSYGIDSMGAKRGIRFMKKMMMHNRKDKKKGTRSPVDWTTPLMGLFPYINANINHGAGVGAIFAVESEVLRIAKVIEDQNLQAFHNFTAEELGLGNGALEFIMGEKDGYEQMNYLLEGNGLPNLSRLAFDFVQRKRQDPNTPVIEKNTGLLINQLAMNEVTGEGFNAKPAALYNSPWLRYFGIFLGWPLWKMARDNRVLQGRSNYVFGKDARTDRATWMAFLKYISMVSAVYAPAGLAFAMLVDWYDDEVLEKPNNLPPISPWAALPVLGPFMAAQNDPNFSIYAITSRLAKAGVPYGLGMDLANSVFSKGDPYGSSKEFSLDSRIFAWSMIKNIYDAMGNWMHQGEIDYQNVTRPIIYGLGGNSVIQFLDATTAMLDLDTTERRMADYIGVRNILKKYAWGMGLDLRPPGKGYGRPTSLSINARQMERAAYNFDTAEFRDAYQEALEAAREQGEQDPEKAVRNRFKRRLILYNITDGKITEQQLNRMYELMDPRESELIQRYLRAHEQYLQMIEVQQPMTKSQQSAVLFGQGDLRNLQPPYQRKDPRLFALGYY